MQVLRRTMRTLARRPGWTAHAVITLALGIGASTAVFAVVNAVLLRPLPVADPDRLVAVWDTNPQKGTAAERLAPARFRDLRERLRSSDQGWRLVAVPLHDQVTGRARMPLLLLAGDNPATSALYATQRGTRESRVTY